MLPGMIFIFEDLPRRLLHEKPMLPSFGVLGVLGPLADLGSPQADLGSLADLGLLGFLGLPSSSRSFWAGVDAAGSATATCGAAVLG